MALYLLRDVPEPDQDLGLRFPASPSKQVAGGKTLMPSSLKAGETTLAEHAKAGLNA